MAVVASVASSNLADFSLLPIGMEFALQNKSSGSSGSRNFIFCLPSLSPFDWRSTFGGFLATLILFVRVEVQLFYFSSTCRTGAFLFDHRGHGRGHEPISKISTAGIGSR